MVARRKVVASWVPEWRPAVEIDRQPARQASAGTDLIDSYLALIEGVNHPLGPLIQIHLEVIVSLDSYYLNYSTLKDCCGPLNHSYCL